MALTTLVAAAPAAATWQASGSGSGRSAAVTMVAVSSATASCAAGGATVTWPTTPYATGYTLRRSTVPGVWTTVSTAAAPGGTVSLSGLAAVSVTWQVVATNQAWTAPASPSSNALTVSALGACL